MKIVYSKYFPPKGFAAINLFGLIIGRSEYGQLSKTELNHENIHTRQIIEMCCLFFYVFYLLEWIIRLAQYRGTTAAYFNISFEREAYIHEKNINYLKHRKWYSWLRYLKKPK